MSDVDRNWHYPDDVDYAIDGSQQGIYDGVIIWVLKDGRIINRFQGNGTRREERVEAYIRENGLRSQPA